MAAAEIRAGKAVVELGVKDQLKKGLDRAAARLRSFATGAAKLGAGTMALGTAILSPFVASISAASELEETMNKFNVVFGEQADAMKQWGDNFAAEVGRSKTEVAGFLASSQDLLVPMGIDPAAARQMSQDILAMTTDLASFNNMADADVFRDMQAALTGSGEVMKKYGVIVSEAAVKQQLMNMGMDPKTATEAQKVQARWQIIVKGTTAAQGDAIRSSGSWENQMKALRARIADTSAVIGTAILPIVTKWLQYGVKLVTNLQDLIQENLGIVRAVAIAGAAIFAVGAVITGVATAALGLSFVLTGLSVVAGWMATAFAAASAVVGGIFSPIGLAVVAVGAATVAFFRFTQAGQHLWATIQTALGNAWQWTRAVFAGIYQAVAAGDLALAAEIAWTAVQVVIATALESIANMVDGLLGGFSATFEGIAAALRSGDIAAAGRIAMAGLFSVWRQGVADLMKVWGDYLKFVVKSFATGMSQVAKLWVQTQGGISKGILSMAEDEGVIGDFFAKFLGVDVREEQKKREALDAGLRARGLNPESQTVGAEMAGMIDGQTAASTAAIDEFVGGALGQFDQFVAGIQEGTQEQANVAGADLQSQIRDALDKAANESTFGGTARENLAQLLEKAALIKPGDDKKPDAMKLPDLPELQEGLQQAAKLPNLATQSSYAVAAMFSGFGRGKKPEEETAKNTKKAAEQLQKLNEKVDLKPAVVFA